MRAEHYVVSDACSFNSLRALAHKLTYWRVCNVDIINFPIVAFNLSCNSEICFPLGRFWFSCQSFCFFRISSAAESTDGTEKDEKPEKGATEEQEKPSVEVTQEETIQQEEQAPEEEQKSDETTEEDTQEQTQAEDE